MHTLRRRRTAIAVALVLAVAGSLAAIGLTLSTLAQPEPDLRASAPSSASAEVPQSASAAARGSLPTGRSASPASSAPPSGGLGQAVKPPLPALFGAIGDSISVAFDVTPDGFGPNPSHEWTFGTAPDDGIYSLLERFRALGGDPLTADEARAGARMTDAAGQATKIVAAARSFGPGKTAFVTIELGGNDACAATPAATFETQLRAAIAILRDGATTASGRLPGLPAGSRLLVLSVPDIGRLRALTAGIPAAQNVYREFGICSRFLGAAVTEADLAAGEARIRAYNAVLERVCEELGQARSAGGPLDCRSDQSGGGVHSMYATVFARSDISTLDYFHPSLSGQGKIADGAWAASYWSATPLPPSADTSASPSHTP